MMTFDWLNDPIQARQALEQRFGDPTRERMTPHQRVETALNLQPADRTPFDFWAVPEVIAALQDFLGVDSEEAVLRLLGVDCRMLWPDYIGPEPQKFPDGSYFTPWGSHRRQVKNQFSTYEEYASFPLAEAASRAEVEAWAGWPKSTYWDWAKTAAQVQALNTPTRYHIRYQVGGIFESAWALYGLERFLVDLVERPEVPEAILDCYTDLMIENTHALMRHARGLVDMVYTYDDVATQNGLLMSPRMWRRFILPRHLRLNAVLKGYGLRIMYHSCGAIYPLVRALIDEMGIAVLNPLQPRAAGMDMARFKREFGAQIAFHGGIDLQETMPHGTPAQVQAEVAERIRVLGAGGGYICATAHYIQADVPLANIIALYTAPRL